MKPFILSLPSSAPIPIDTFDPITIPDNSYSWWCKPISIRKHGFNWLSMVNSTGGQEIYKISEDGTYISYVINTGLAKDEHNTASFLVRDTDIIVTYTGHEISNLYMLKLDLNFNITQSVQSIMTSGSFSYSQLIESNGKVFCFTRSSRQNWDLVISSDGGATWGTPFRFISKDPSLDGMLYMATQQYGDTINIGMYNHPIQTIADNALNSLEIDTLTGDVSSLGSVITNVYSGFVKIMAASLTHIHTEAAGTSFRFLDLAEDATFKYYLLADFLFSEVSDIRSGKYKMLILRKSNSVTSIVDIVNHGKDTYQSYFGGAYFSQTLQGVWDNTIYLSREESEIWYVEKHTWNGTLFTKIETIDTLASGQTDNSGLSLNRPQPPYNNSTGAKIVYQKGDYFTGYENWDNEIKLI